MTAKPLSPSLYSDIRQALNKHNAESGSNTPDVVLAEFLCDCLSVFDDAIEMRERLTRRSESRAPSEGAQKAERADETEPEDLPLGERPGDIISTDKWLQENFGHWLKKPLDLAMIERIAMAGIKVERAVRKGLRATHAGCKKEHRPADRSGEE